MALRAAVAAATLTLVVSYVRLLAVHANATRPESFDSTARHQCGATDCEMFEPLGEPALQPAVCSHNDHTSGQARPCSRCMSRYIDPLKRTRKPQHSPPFTPHHGTTSAHSVCSVRANVWISHASISWLQCEAALVGLSASQRSRPERVGTRAASHW